MNDTKHSDIKVEVLSFINGLSNRFNNFNVDQSFTFFEPDIDGYEIATETDFAFCDIYGLYEILNDIDIIKYTKFENLNTIFISGVYIKSNSTVMIKIYVKED